MNNNFEYLIKNNFDILVALFHATENGVKVIDDKKRIIKKDVYISRILDVIPIFKDLFKDTYKDLIVIPIKIKEIYNDYKKEFSYKIKIKLEEFKNVDLYLKLTQDKNNINASINIYNSNFNFDFIYLIASSYYKIAFLENELKPLISKISHRSFVLNII